MDGLDQQHDHGSDENALAAAQAAQAAAIHLDLGALQAESHQHEFEHHLQQPDFSHTKSDGTPHTDVDVHALDIPVEGQDEMSLAVQDAHLSLALEAHTPHHVDTPRSSPYNRPPSIRKACDLCHQAKQKCSGDRPSCTRCAQGGWNCNYAPRQRRRTVPKDQKQSLSLDSRNSNPYGLMSKKRKLQRDGLIISDTMDMRMAMGMAMDLGLGEEEEDEHLLTLTDEQMLDSIAVDGYLDDLPLQTFVNNLPFNQPQSTAATTFTSSDFHDANDGAYSSEMDQHTTSALRDAIFSLNESSNAGVQNDGPPEGHQDNTDQQGIEGIDGQGLDPHLALLDLSHAMPVEDGNNTGTDGTGDLNLGSLGGPQYSAACPHVAMVPRILALLHQHALEPKPGSNTPLTMYIFAPLSRALRLFHSVTQCPHCVTSPQQTLPQLALLSRTTTILTYGCPPPPPNAAGQPSAQIVVHGARLSMTGISEAIEQHIVGVVWDSWRASVREIFNAFERKAQDVIQQNAQLAAEQGGQPPASSSETQRAGLMFQAMSRLVTAMNEVERD